jgi:hypothetical protein
MTKVATTLRSAYLAGPMRGYPEYNFPAFHKATAKLRADGWRIDSPAERDEADQSINHAKDRAGWADHLGLDYFMQFDLAMVCRADCAIVLPGWEKSQGARLETAVATEVGHPVFEFTQKLFGKYELKAVNPDYVLEIFAINAGVKFVAQGGCQGECGECECSSAGEVLPSAVDIILDGLEIQGGPVDEGPKDEIVSSSLPADSAARKAVPVATGVLDYFPAALVEVARVSKAGNDKHNPGQPLHHARGKSMDHADALLRHLIDRGTVDEETGQRHSAEVAWRALALLQQELEDEGLAPRPRGAW